MTGYPKPPDCQCRYPRVIHSDITGHASDCPAREWIHSRLAVMAGLQEGTRFKRAVWFNTSPEACELTIGSGAATAWSKPFSGESKAMDAGKPLTITIEGMP